LALPPSADDPNSVGVVADRVVVDDYEYTRVDTPFSVPVIGLADSVQRLHGVIDTGSRQPALGKPLFRVRRPIEVMDCHRLPRLRCAWDATLGLTKAVCDRDLVLPMGTLTRVNDSLHVWNDAENGVVLAALRDEARALASNQADRAALTALREEFDEITPDWPSA
jgi:hypothetical protein